MLLFQHFFVFLIKVKVKLLSSVWLFVTPWTVAYQSLSMGFSRQEYWSELPFLINIIVKYAYNLF